MQNMDEPVLRAKEVYEGAKIDHFHDRAVIDLADLRIARDGFDPIDRRADRIAVGRSNFYRSIILNINLGAGFLDDLADYFAAGPDHFADLFGGNSKRLDAGCEFAKFRPRARKR